MVGMKKKEMDAPTLCIYACIALFILYFGAALGACIDISYETYGNIDITSVTDDFEKTLTQVNVVIEKVFTKGSYASKTLLCTIGVGGFWLLYRATTKKRFHRQGVEHGAARWATEREAAALVQHKNNKKNQKHILYIEDKELEEKIEVSKFSYPELINLCASEFGWTIENEEEKMQIFQQIASLLPKMTIEEIENFFGSQGWETLVVEKCEESE